MRSPLLINEPPLQVLPTLAKTIGLNEAIILQQVHYWLNPQLNKNMFEGKHWVYNTFTQWEQQFAFWSIPTIKRIIGSLEKSGLLLSFSPRDFRRTKYYAINYELLNSTYLHDTHASAKINKTPSNIYVKASEYQVSHPLGQNNPIDDIKMISSIVSSCNSPSVQNDTIDCIKLISSHNTENTIEITSENTPPLTPPLQLSARTKEEEEEEEEEEIYFKQEHSNWNSEPNPTMPWVDTDINEEEIMQEKQTQELDLCSELVMLWNQIVQNKLGAGPEAYLTTKRKALLMKFLKEVLHNTTRAEKIDAWQNYCTLIAKTKFLIGGNPNGFKVTLDWALVPDNAFKVLEGAYYDKPSLSKGKQDCPTWEEFSEELARTLPSSKYLTEWVKMSVIIAKFIGQEKYKAWFTKVVLSEVTETTATFLVEGQFTKDSIIRYFSSEIRCAVQTFYPKVTHIEFKVVPPLGEAA